MGVLEVIHEVPGFLGKRKGSARLGLSLATLTQPFRLTSKGSQLAQISV